MLKRQCYIRPLISIKLYEGKKWVIQKNIEAEEKWGRKREEQERKIKRNKIYSLNEE